MDQRGPIGMGMGGRRCPIRTAWAAELQECQVLSQAWAWTAVCTAVQRSSVSLSTTPETCPKFGPSRMARKSTVPCEISTRSTASQRPCPYMVSSSSFVKVTGDGYLDVFLEGQRQKRRRVRRTVDTNNSITLAAYLRRLSSQ